MVMDGLRAVRTMEFTIVTRSVYESNRTAYVNANANEASRHGLVTAGK